MEPGFTVFPAIDLRAGQVVRLRYGDPNQQTVYGSDPALVAERWLSAGARWLHVVNLDGAFGDPDAANWRGVGTIVATAARFGARVQMGGGLRSLEALQAVFDLGVERAILGTAAVEQPELLRAALARWGDERITVGIDARDGVVRVRGWAEDSPVQAVDLALQQKNAGVRWVVFTDISRDGVQTGVNWQATADLARATGLNVVASGGVKGMEDVRMVRQAGLSGIIVGRAFYEDSLDPKVLFSEG